MEQSPSPSLVFGTGNPIKQCLSTPAGRARYRRRVAAGTAGRSGFAILSDSHHLIRSDHQITTLVPKRPRREDFSLSSSTCLGMTKWWVEIRGSHSWHLSGMRQTWSSFPYQILRRCSPHLLPEMACECRLVHALGIITANLREEDEEEDLVYG